MILPKDIKTHIGIVLVFVAVYTLSNAGRIDIIDGQWRFEVAYNIMSSGTVDIRDPALTRMGIPTKDGSYYGFYGLSGSLFAAPLLAMGQLILPGNIDFLHFCFSLLSPLLGAATLMLLYGFYRYLGINSQSAALWTCILGISTLFFPLATSVFDQVQNAFFLLASVVLSYIGGKEKSWSVSALGGACFIALINYKEAYLILFPCLLWLSGQSRVSNPFSQLRKNPAPAALTVATFIAVASLVSFNWVRFDQLHTPAANSFHPEIWGNAFVGLAGLTISPGKGILWYSPAALLPVFGARALYQSNERLAKGIAIIVVTWLALISSLSFYGGDWCWGPRYWVPILPLIFVAAPWIKFDKPAKRAFAIAVIATSTIIQLLAIAVDHQKYYFDRSLVPFFWASDPYYHFSNSPLLARLTEVRSLKLPEPIPESTIFRPGPYPSSRTYTFFGPGFGKSRLRGKQWVDQYPVFNLPRPWPAWSIAVLSESGKRYRMYGISVLALSLVTGILLIASGMKYANDCAPSPSIGET